MGSPMAWSSPQQVTTEARRHGARPTRKRGQDPFAAGRGRKRVLTPFSLASAVALVSAAALAAPVTIETPQTVATLDPAAGYAVTQLTDRVTGQTFLAAPAEGQDRSLWWVVLRDAAGKQYTLRPGDAAQAALTAADGGMKIVWSQVRQADCQADLTVTVTINPREDGALGWRISVAGSAAAEPWRLDFPRILAVQSIGDDQLALPIFLGRVMADPGRRAARITLDNPQPAAMQWFAFWGTPERREPDWQPVADAQNETGWMPDRSAARCLMWGTADGRGQYKRYVVDGTVSPTGFGWWVEHVPALTTWPISEGVRPVAYDQPYDVVTSTFTGDWLDAARRYESWAKGQVWCGRGTMDTWPDTVPDRPEVDAVRWTPPWFREVGFWAKFYQEPAKVVPEWGAYAKWLGVPMASHYYRHPISRFDDNYPEHLPADPFFLQGVRAARQMGVQPLPYVQGSIWDTDTQSWFREHAVAAAAKNEAGEIYPWNIADEIHAHMNPATQLWQDKMVEVGQQMIGEHGCAGIYLDVLDASRPYLNYDASQKAGIHGGNYWAAGNRRLLYELRKATREVEPGASFFSEAIGEMYLDLLDGHLSLDQMRFSSGRSGEQTWPLFPAVYHPYTINFGCDADLSHAPDLFAWEMGQMLIWGSVPLNSMPGGTLPKPGDPASEFLREVVQAYWQAGRPFLCGGRLERLTVVPDGTKPAATGPTLTSPSYDFTYKLRGADRVWHGPAVMASAWSRGNRQAFVLVNVTDTDRQVTLHVPAAAGKLSRLWPDPAELTAGRGTHKLTVPARKVMILQLSAEAPPALVPPVAMPWVLQTVEDGPFPPLSAAAGTLWACDDAPVACQVEAGLTTAQAEVLGNDGKLAVRTGLHPKGGAPMEGKGLPRPADRQPFLLLRKLPHTISGAGEALVWSADGTHLLGTFDGGLTILFDEPGLAIVRNLADGSLTRPLSDEMVEELVLPAEGRYLVGYAELTALRPHLALPGEVLPMARLVGSLRELLVCPPTQRELFLSETSQALFELQAGLKEPLGALLGGRPLRRLHDAVQSLVAARVGWLPVGKVDDDWLAPEVPKQVRYAAWVPGAAEDPLGIELRVLGGWPIQGVEVPRAQGDRVPLSTLPLTFAFKVGEVVERLAPVLTAADVVASNKRYRVSSLLFLEANRPYEIQGQDLPLTAVGGRTAQAKVNLRNWSPLPLNIHLTVSGPEGWHFELPADVEVPPLSDKLVPVAVTPSLQSARGSYQLLATSNHAEANECQQIALIDVALLKNLVPLTTDGDWQPPEPDNQATIRRNATLAVVPEGDRITGTIRNVKVTIYSDTLSWRLLDPDLQEVAKGQVKVDESYDLDEPAAKPGCYTLEVAPNSGSGIVTLNHRHVAEVATPDQHLKLYNSDITRYFAVPEGAQTVGIGWLDGGPDETCRFKLTSPTGRVALDFEENSTGVPRETAVEAGEAGVWELRIEPRQDIDVWLTGDAQPYLSSSPARVLREAR